jgi:two-component system CheB/CheR fusion protein
MSQTDNSVLKSQIVEAEERFRAIIDQGMAGIAQTDLTGKFNLVNDRYCEMTGYSREELLEMRMRDITHEEDLPVNLAQFERLLTTGESFVIEKRYRRKDGALVWVSNSISLIRDPDGNPKNVLAFSIDLSERKMAEQALHRREEQFRNLLENLPAAAYTCNSEGLITFYNQRAATLWGRTPKLNDPQDRFCDSFKLFYADGRPMPYDLCWMALSLADKQYDGFEVVIERPDGTRFTALAHANPMHDESGKLAGAVNVLVDITDRKQAEEAMARLVAIIDSSNDAIVGKDLNGIITSWNTSAEKIFGYTQEEVVGKSIKIIIPPDRIDEEARILGRIRHGEPVKHYDTVRRRKDGTMINVSLTISPVRDKNGKIIGASKIARDITERILAEEALRESEAKFRTLTEVAPALIWFDDAEGNCKFVNQRYLDFSGKKPEELQGSGWHLVLHPDDADDYLTDFQAAQREHRAFHHRTRARRHDGMWRWIESYAQPLFASDGTFLGHVGVSPDITESVKYEDLLKEADRRKDEFLATLAHELRNPLAPIRAALEIMRRYDVEEKYQQAREIIERQLHQIVRLVDDLLDISRITQGKIILQTETVELQKVIEIALETARPAIDGAGHTLEVLLPDEPIYLEADETRLAQVFLNLLNNAARYTPPGGKISIKAETEDHQVTVSVSDTGHGISAELMPHIFELFTQGSPVQKPDQSGLGIGLSLVKRLTEKHGGTVEAQSEGPGKGSQFIVHLPLTSSARPAAAGGRNRRIIEPPTEHLLTNLKPRKILVVDDNPDAAMMLEVLLTMDGHTVRTAHNGQTAVDIALEFQPDLIFLDIGLPDIDGYEVAERIRGRLPRALLVALSGWGQETDRRRSEAAGFNLHLVKPLDFTILPELLVAAGRD